MGIPLSPTVQSPAAWGTRANIGKKVYPLLTGIEVSADVTDYGYRWGDARRYGAALDGVTDDTTAFAKTITLAKMAGGPSAYWPAGTTVISSVTLDGSGYKVLTEGFRTIIQQKSGQPDDTQTVVIKGARIKFGGCKCIGNIATDAQEFHHFVYVYDKAQAGVTIEDIEIGPLYGQDLRGDVLYVGGTATSPVYNVRCSSVDGANVYRNKVSVTGGQLNIGVIKGGGGVGYRDFDSEPNNNSQIPDVTVGRLWGASVQLAGFSSTIYSGSTIIDDCDLDLSRQSNSVPGYPSYPGTNGFAILATTFASLQIGRLKMRNYNYAPVGFGASTFKGHVRIGHVDVASCDQTETTYNSIFAEISTGCLASLTIDSIRAVLVAPVSGNVRRVFIGNNPIVHIKNGTITGGSVAAFAAYGHFENLVVDMDNTTDIAFNSSPDARVQGCTFANAASATLHRLSDRIQFENCSGTFATVNNGSNDPRYINSIINSITYRANCIDASATYDPPSLASGASTSTTVTCTDAALGDFAVASFSLDLTGFTVSCYVSAENTVTVRLRNDTGSAVDLASGTLRVRVFKL